MASPIRVDVWSDVVCPWCYIGKRRFERAVEALRPEFEVAVRYRPYQLDPTASPGATMPVAEAYARKFGGPERAAEMIANVTRIAAGEGLEFRLDRALRANTLLAHRLIWLAEQPDTCAQQAHVKERLLQAYFVDGLDIGDPLTLARLGHAAGLAEPEAITEFLDGRRGRDEVAADLDSAAELGITAVPTYVVNDTWAIPGAQETDTFVAALRRVHAKLA